MLMMATIVSMMMVGSLFIGAEHSTDDIDEAAEDEAPTTAGEPDQGYFDLENPDMLPPAPEDQPDLTLLTLDGTDGDDRLLGDDDADLIKAGDGRDEIAGRDGDDILFGENGDDDVHGEDGNDHLYGGAGADWLSGENGDDSVDGGDGADVLFGHLGNDQLFGGDGADELTGGQGDDLLLAGNGDDQLVGGYGDDTLTGGTGSDTMMGGRGDDVLVGSVPMNDGSDADGRDYLNGGRGDDTLYVGQDDIASGGDGADRFHLQGWAGGAVSQIMDFDAAEDQIVISYPTGSEPPSDVTLAASEDDTDTMIISVDGAAVAAVSGGTGLSLDDITILDAGDVSGDVR